MARRRMWLGLIMLVASAPCQICSLRYPGMTQPTAPGLGAWQSARLQVRALRLNGGGEAEGTRKARQEDEVAHGRSWKETVNAETRVPFEIMGSPLLPDAEIERLARLRRDQPNSTYGQPDFSGRRWRTLPPSASKTGPYARVQLPAECGGQEEFPDDGTFDGFLSW